MPDLVNRLRYIARDNPTYEVGIMEEAATEIERLRKENELMANFLKRLTPEKYPDTLFISGISGTKDENNLPEYIHVVPAYGVDWHMMYQRTDKTWGPQW